MTARQKNLLKKDLIGWSFCLVPIVLFIAFILVPLIMSFYISLTDYSLTNMKFVGLQNFKTLFTTDLYRNNLLQSFLNVLIYTAMVIPLTLVSNIAVAALLQNKLKGAKVFRILYYLPALTSSVVMALIWSWFFNAAYSPINAVLEALGISPFPFLTSTKTAMITLVMMVVWSGLGGGLVMYSAAMQTVPGEYYEAAKIDGAGAVRQFFAITFPMIRPTIYFNCTMGIIGSLQLFDPVYLLTNGGPEGATMSPAWLIYTMSFETEKKPGLGAAMAFVLFVLVMIVTAVFQKTTKEQVV